MKLELTDEQRYVLELTIEDQLTDLYKRERKRHDRERQKPHEPYSVDMLIRHRTILERLLIDVRYPT